MTEIITENSSLLDRYYDERALSSLPGQGYDPYFQFGQIQWGYDLIEDLDGADSVVNPIPTDMTELQNVFHTSDALYSYNNGSIIITTSIATGEIPEGESYQFSALGILDAVPGLVAVCVMLPMYVYSNRGLDATIIIKLAKDGTVESMSAKVTPKK
ncbi:hypothetical protein I6Y99_004421 [Vibrio parahaemolyticus]|nr:hypothetical protein [Vibrio parahaemolyticus]